MFVVVVDVRFWTHAANQWKWRREWWRQSPQEMAGPSKFSVAENLFRIKKFSSMIVMARAIG
jgi:hypothetical protein